MSAPLKQSTKNFYERFWKDSLYTLSYSFDSAVRDRYPAIKKVWGDMCLPNKVLDYGCGNGVLTYWLSCNGFGNEIYGVDVSRTGVNYANKSFIKERLTFTTLDELPELSITNFDVTVCSHVLEHIEHPELILKGISEKTEWLVLEVPLERCIWPALASFFLMKTREDNPVGHVNFWNKKTFRAFLAKADLLVVRDYHYVSAPFSPYTHIIKRIIELILLKLLGLHIYSKLMVTHYAVLIRKINE
jgi:SAM-dependent methyltransferase